MKKTNLSILTLGDGMRCSKVSLFFFVFIFNYISLRILVFPYLYESSGGNGVLYFGLILMGIVPFFLFLPKKIYNTDFSSSYEKSKFKYVFNTYLWLRVILGIAITSYALQSLFFHEYSILWFLGSFGFIILLISSLSHHDVIQISTLFGIVIILSYLFYGFKLIDLDFHLITRNLDFKFDFMYILLPYCFIFDNLIYFLSTKYIQKTRWNITFAILFSCLVLGLEYANLVLSSGNHIFSKDLLIGFQSLGIESVSRYNGNFRYIYILILTTTCVFKYSYFFSMIEKTQHIKRSRKYNAIIFILLIGLSYLVTLGFNTKITWLIYIFLGLFLFGGILILWIFKECYHVRKIKE